MLAVKPKRALTPIHNAVQAATRAVTGGHESHHTSPRWVPHVTVCYSTSEQAMAPGRCGSRAASTGCQIQISTVSLIIQHGPERLWDWHTVGTVRLPAPAQTHP
jgi:hypothetical protein